MKSYEVTVDGAALPPGILSKDFEAELAVGKYTRWAVGISEAAMQHLLRGMQTASNIYNRKKAETGCYPEPDYSNCMGGNERSTEAIRWLADFFAGSSAIPTKSISFQGPAFSEWFQSKLECDGVSLIAGSDAQDIYNMFWNVGEYSVRIGYDEQPDFPLPRESLLALKRALRSIALVYSRLIE